MLILPKHKDVEVSGLIRLAGEFRLVARRQDGSISRDSGWFDNLILDSGLNRMGTGVAISGCAISTGTATPVASQTGLQGTPIWTTTVSVSTAGGASSGAPYYFSATYTYRFPIGTLNGNYNEVGVGWGSTTMFSRALIVDGGGSPLSFPVQPTEQLDVVYRIRAYHATTDTTANLTIGGVATTVTGRPARLTSTSNINWAPLASNIGDSAVALRGSSNQYYLYNGALGAVTSSPSGTSSSGSTYTNGAYSNNSYSATGSATWATGYGNVAGGATAAEVSWNGISASFQYGFAPAIVKDNTKTLTLNFTVGWGRRP